ncbi:MAG: RIP metalloprotease RseP [Candidatus Bipolaricaulota bacterium]|nr:RIP metalloprotease RseP [Candidatus Bipolaricaulota bacterium]
MITLLLFLGTIIVLVGVHEGGHFLAAKLLGVYVKEFAIGFGPRLASIRRGETRYSIRAIPFGGYVSMAGEDREETDPEIPTEKLLYSKPPFTRILISLAGPASNLLMTLVVVTFSLWTFGIPLVQVSGLVPGKPAAVSLLPGDRIISVTDVTIYTSADLDRAVQGSQGEPVEVLIEREGERHTFTITPQFDEEAGRYLIGIYPSPITYTNRLSALEPSSVPFASGLRAGDTIVSVEGVATEVGGDVLRRVNQSLPTDSIEVTVLRAGVEESHTMQTTGLDFNGIFAGVTFSDLGVTYRRPGFIKGIAMGAGEFAGYVQLIVQWIRGVVAGRIAASETVAGPIGIARMLGDWAQEGASVFLHLFAYLSLSLGLLNLIPFPALDGSRAAFALYEIIRGRPIPPQREGMIHAIGFFILIALMLLITYQDILKLFR